MKRVVRDSKFRHCFGRVPPKDELFDGISACDSRVDGNICAVNRKFIAVVLVSSGGGVFTVVRKDKPGRMDRLYRCTAHTSNVVDLSFDRFFPNRLASGGDDGSFIIWIIPPTGLESDLSEFYCQFKPSQRRALQCEWHPSASNVFIGVNIDCITIFNVKKPSVIRSLKTSNFNEQMFSFTLNYNGTMCAAAFKDKKIRVFDLATMDKTAEFECHEGSKPIRVAWMTRVYDDEILVTTGATKSASRQISVWNLKSPSQPLCTEELDNASSALNIVYDQDTHLFVFHGKGESSIRMYEFDMEPEPKLHNVCTYTAQDSHRACAFGSKLACNFNAHEILNIIRVTIKGLEPLAIVVPRKSEEFQEDLYPETPGEIAAMEVEQFMDGKVCDPALVNLKGFVFDDGTAPPCSTGGSTCVTVNRNIGEVTNSIHGSTMNIYDLNNEVSDLKSQLETLKKRVEKLEQK